MAAGNDSQKTRGPYPIAELLSLLATFTFSQPRTEGLQRCLVAWSAFVAQATIEEGEGSAADVERSAALARENAGGLQSVCRVSVRRADGKVLDEISSM